MGDADTSASELMNLAISRYHMGAIDSSIRLLKEVIQQAVRGDDIEIQLLALSNICEAYQRIGKFNEVIENAEQLYKLSKQHKRIDNEVRAIGRLAMAVLEVSLRERWTEIRQMLLDSIEKARAIGLTYWIVQNLEVLGSCSARMGEYENSYNWLIQGLSEITSDLMEQEFFRSRFYQSLSYLQRVQGNYELALDCAEASIRAATFKGHRPHLLSTAKLQLAYALYHLNRIVEASSYLDEIITICINEGWELDETRALELKGKIFFDQLKYIEAINSQSRSLYLARKMKLREEEVIYLINYGNYLLRNGQKTEATATLQEAKQVAHTRKFPDLEDKASLLLQIALA